MVKLPTETIAATWQIRQSECTPSEDSNQPGHLANLISLNRPHEETLGPYLPTERTAKTLIRQDVVAHNTHHQCSASFSSVKDEHSGGNQTTLHVPRPGDGHSLLGVRRRIFLLVYNWNHIIQHWSGLQNQQLGYTPSEDSDQPGHPHSLIRVFAVRSMGS